MMMARTSRFSHLYTGTDDPHPLRAKACQRLLKAHRNLALDADEMFGSINPTAAIEIQNMLLMAGAAASIDDPAGYGTGMDIVKLIADHPPTEKYDELYIAFISFGLAGFEDLSGAYLNEDDRTLIQDLLNLNTEWLHRFRHGRAFGRGDKPGVFAWNHTVVPALAASLAVLKDRNHRRFVESVWFALDRFEKFLCFGISEKGLPYEGFFYCGVVFRVIGLYRHLVKQSPEVAAIFEDIVARHRSRLDGLLDWYAINTLPRGRLISYNHSPYNSKMAIAGLLPFFAEDRPSEVFAVWNRLVGPEGDGTLGAASKPKQSSIFDAALFLPPADRIGPVKIPDEISDRAAGMVTFRHAGKTGDSILFLKSGPVLFGVHNQSDINHFTYVSQGFPITFDAGPGKKNRLPGKKWAVYSHGTYRVEGSGASSYGHNAVLIDDLGQALSGDGFGVEGQILRCKRNEGFVLISADATQAYNRDNYNPVRFARRHVIMIKHPTELLIVFDDIAAVGTDVRKFEYRLHLPEVDCMERVGSVINLNLKDGKAARSVRFQHLAPDGVELELDANYVNSGMGPMSLIRGAFKSLETLFVYALIPVPTDSDAAPTVRLGEADEKSLSILVEVDGQLTHTLRCGRYAVVDGVEQRGTVEVFER